MKIVLYSFDVFDTLITRRVAEPKGIFAVMQETLRADERYRDIDAHIRDNFFQLRINSEALARANFQRKGVEDVSLEQIYRAMGTTGDLDEAGQALLMRLEKDTELENVVGIEENIAQVKKLLTAGERVILISDMYLDAASIRAMLMRVDGAFVNVPIYVSSEQKKGKYTGRLYYKVRDLEGAAFEAWTHCGDNEQSDVALPERLGIATTPYAPPRLLPIEEARMHGHEDDAETQRIIGTARALRFNCRMGLPETIGVSVGGPILFAYASWVLREAQKRHIKRLYFIARDGYIPKLIVDRLIAEWHIDGIETHYIYGSRRAWRMPSYDGEPGTLRWMTSTAYPDGMTTIQKIASYLQISVEKLCAYLPEKYRDSEKKLSWIEICLCFFHLEQQAEFRQFLRKEMAPLRELARQYLENEINTQDDSFAFVDLEGRGVTQVCLSKIMRDFCPFPIKTFFFSLWEINRESGCEHYNFLPSFLEHNILISALCRAPHGQTDGYERRKDGQVMPILRNDEGLELQKRGYEEYIGGIESFAKAYLLSRAAKIDVDFVLSYLGYVASYKDASLSGYFAEMPNTTTGREQKTVEFAPRLTKEDIRNLFLLHPGSYAKHYKGNDLLLSQKRCTPSEQRRIKRYQERRTWILDRYEQLFHRSLLSGEPRTTESTMEIIFRFIGRRVALYGAGRYGSRMYGQFKEAGAEVVAWMDKNSDELKRRGMPIDGTMDIIGKIRFDKLFILILDERVSEPVRREFIARGVPEEKIITGAFWRYQEKFQRYLIFEWI